jgi:hypothetical protein
MYLRGCDLRTNWIEVTNNKVLSVQWNGDVAGDVIEGTVENFESILTRTGNQAPVDSLPVQC